MTQTEALCKDSTLNFSQVTAANFENYFIAMGGMCRMDYIIRTDVLFLTKNRKDYRQY